MRRNCRAGAAFFKALPLFFSAYSLFAQTPPPSPVTVTPTLVSIQLGQPAYCAAKWTPLPVGTIQVYCYTTVKTTWDTLTMNMIFPAFTGVYLPYAIPNLSDGTTPDTAHGILWLFRKDPTSGKITWSLAWSGTGMQTGTFQ